MIFCSHSSAAHFTAAAQEIRDKKSRPGEGREHLPQGMVVHVWRPRCAEVFVPAGVWTLAAHPQPAAQLAALTALLPSLIFPSFAI